jgi:enoyl-CoA hydratase
VTATYETILVSTDGPVGLIQLNRPKVLNALNRQVTSEILAALKRFDADPAIRCTVVHGSERAFASGADIPEMAQAGAAEMQLRDQFEEWDAIARIHKPIIAAVSGFALGGGCELAMMCDMIIASETAVFGQAEIELGVIPGAGGTQRLTRAVGKALAMEMVLANRWLTAHEAKAAGLVNGVVPVEAYLEEAVRLAKAVAAKPPVAVRLGKEAVLKAFEMTLAEGLAFERKNFYLLFDTEDQKEGMAAFVEKRKPNWKGR